MRSHTPHPSGSFRRDIEKIILPGGILVNLPLILSGKPLSPKQKEIDMKYRHVRANSDEWIVVHRNRPSQDNDGCGWIAIVIILAFIGSLIS